MSKAYVIQWKSLVNGRGGKGTKLFELDEARLLANELNQDYPAIQHEPVEANSQAPEPGPEAQQPESAEEVEDGSENPQVTLEPDPALSFQ